MKVEVKIDSLPRRSGDDYSTYTIYACRENPWLWWRVDQGALMPKGWEAYLIESQLFNVFTLKIGKWLVRPWRINLSDWTTLSTIWRLTDLLSKISQSEIINTKEIGHLHFTSGGSVQIYLKNGSLTYSSVVTRKPLRRNYHAKTIFSDALKAFSSGHLIHLLFLSLLTWVTFLKSQLCSRVAGCFLHHVHGSLVILYCPSFEGAIGVPL